MNLTKKRPSLNCVLRYAPSPGSSQLPRQLQGTGRRCVRHITLKVGFAMLALLAAGCGTPTHPCGRFTFTGSPHSNRGINAQVDFDFDPAACGAVCNCATICYVQIVRIIDIDTGNFLAPNTDQQNRIVTGDADATQNGWAVDRLSGRIWGYYGRNNDGTFASTLTPGSNTSTATLRDAPSGWPNNSWFDAVSVPVCIDAAAACDNRLLGYEYWLFSVNDTGTASAPFNEIGVTWMQSAFDKAADRWNNNAPGLGKNTFPAMSALP